MRGLLVRSWIPAAVLAATLASGPVAVASVSPAGAAAASRPGVEDCGTGAALVRPASLILTCADDGELATHLAWSSWTPTRAAAAGIVTWKNCVPSCAESRRWSSASADVTLSGPVTTRGHTVVFTRLVLHVTGRTRPGFLRNLTFYEGPLPSARPSPARSSAPGAGPAPVPVKARSEPSAAPSGTLQYAPIEGYWVYAGGLSGADPSVSGYTYAQVSAAVTGAESSFQPGVIQPDEPYSTTGWGLWQITPGNELPVSFGVSQYGTDFQLLDPWNNAESAVYLCNWDVNHGENCFERWSTYTSGTFRSFLQAASPDMSISDPGEYKYIAASGIPSGTPASPPSDPGSTYGPPMPNAGSNQIAFQANTGDLWYDTATNAGHRDTGLAMAANSSPSVAPTGEVAFEGSNNHVWLYDPSTGASRDTGLGMPANTITSPDIVSLTGGGYEMAFQANTGILWLNDPSTGTSVNTGLGMFGDSSPAITATSGGGYAVAFQADTGHLWYYTPANSGHRDTGLAMAADTSPSIASTGEVAFEGSNNHLWLYDPSTGASRDTGLGMPSVPSGTSPDIVSLTGGGYEIAFQANTGILWLNNPSTGTSVNTGLGMGADSSPAITATSGGSYAVAFQNDTGDLWYYTPANSGDRDTGLGMEPGTGPAIAAS